MKQYELFINTPHCYVRLEVINGEREFVHSVANYAVNDIWVHLNNELLPSGIKFVRDDGVNKKHKLIAPGYKYMNWHNLECDVEIHNNNISFSFYQNINTGNRKEGHGKYALHKYQLMPYLIRKRYHLFIKKIKEALTSFGNVGTVEVPIRELAEERIIADHKSSRRREGISSLQEIALYMTQYDLVSNNKDRDGRVINCGDVKYFRHHNGRIYRGVAYHNMNNGWDVIVNKYEYYRLASSSLFDLTSDDFNKRRVKRGGMPDAKKKEIEFLNTLSEGCLLYLLQKKLRLKQSVIRGIKSIANI